MKNDPCCGEHLCPGNGHNSNRHFKDGDRNNRNMICGNTVLSGNPPFRRLWRTLPPPPRGVLRSSLRWGASSQAVLGTSAWRPPRPQHPPVRPAPCAPPPTPCGLSTVCRLLLHDRGPGGVAQQVPGHVPPGLRPQDSAGGDAESVPQERGGDLPSGPVRRSGHGPPELPGASRRGQRSGPSGVGRAAGIRMGHRAASLRLGVAGGAPRSLSALAHVLCPTATGAPAFSPSMSPALTPACPA